MTAVKHLHHIGIAVHDLESSIEWVTNVLGLELGNVEVVESEQVRVAFFDIGETRIELLEPLSEESAIAVFLQKRGQGVHHLAFEVDGLKDYLHRLEEKQISLIHKEPKEGAHQMQIAFLHPRSTGGVLVECCEKKGEK